MILPFITMMFKSSDGGEVGSCQGDGLGWLPSHRLHPMDLEAPSMAQAAAPAAALGLSWHGCYWCYMDQAQTGDTNHMRESS